MAVLLACPVAVVGVALGEELPQPRLPLPNGLSKEPQYLPEVPPSPSVRADLRRRPKRLPPTGFKNAKEEENSGDVLFNRRELRSESKVCGSVGCGSTLYDRRTHIFTSEFGPNSLQRQNMAGYRERIPNTSKYYWKKFRHFRPPGGALDNFGVLASSDLSVDLWSLSISDWLIHYRLLQKNLTEAEFADRLKKTTEKELKKELWLKNLHILDWVRGLDGGFVYCGHDREMIYKTLDSFLDLLISFNQFHFVRMDECTGIPETF